MKYLLIYIFISFSTVLFSQQDSLEVKYDSKVIEQKKFDTNQIEKYRADKDFDYTEKKQEQGFFAKVWNWFKRILQRFFEWLFGVERATGALEAFLSILPYLILAVVLYFLLRFFLKVDSNTLLMKGAERATISLTEEEELIKSENIQQLIDQAIAKKNYRLAIRYLYLSILQSLASKELINWQQEKTNEDYIKEIEKIEVKDKFTKSTLLYDFVWYGNFQINEPEFVKAQKEFNALKNLI